VATVLSPTPGEASLARGSLAVSEGFAMPGFDHGVGEHLDGSVLWMFLAFLAEVPRVGFGNK
jgi:hypothetical protein